MRLGLDSLIDGERPQVSDGGVIAGKDMTREPPHIALKARLASPTHIVELQAVRRLRNAWTLLTLR